MQSGGEVRGGTLSPKGGTSRAEFENAEVYSELLALYVGFYEGSGVARGPSASRPDTGVALRALDLQDRVTLPLAFTGVADSHQVPISGSARSRRSV